MRRLRIRDYAAEARQRKTLREIDQRVESSFWQSHDRPCYECGVDLTGNDALLGYCEECRKRRTTDFNNERYLKAQVRLQAREYQRRKEAQRAK